MLLDLRKTTTAAITALSLAVALPAPALAWGERQQNTLAALAAAGLIGTLIYQNNKQRQHAAPVTRAPVTQYPRYQEPRYQEPRYQGQRYQGQRYQEPASYQSNAASSVYATPAARAFNSYTLSQRRAIQSRLSQAGYYQGGIDGSFGPMTYRAVTAIAGDTSTTNPLATMSGALEFYDAILG
jgi:hypothetical protein